MKAHQMNANKKKQKQNYIEKKWKQINGIAHCSEPVEMYPEIIEGAKNRLECNGSEIACCGTHYWPGFSGSIDRLNIFIQSIWT